MPVLCFDIIYLTLILITVAFLAIYQYFSMTNQINVLQTQKCPECPVCPNNNPVVITQPTVSPVSMPPIIPTVDPLVIGSEYRITGYLYRKNSKADDKYKVLPVFGKPYRNGDFFKYYTEYKSDGQIFRLLINKNGKRSNRDYSRELYDKDEIYVGFPIDGQYEFHEHKIDLYDDDPYY